MKYVPLSIALGLAALTAACGQKSDAPVSPQAHQTAPAMEAMNGDMGNMDMTGNLAMAPAADAAVMAKGSGTVKAIDKAAGTITLDHGPIPQAKWPAMTMTFKASPAILGPVKAGDKVAFDLKLVGSAGEVTGITKQ